MEKDEVLVCMVLGFLGSVAVTLGFVANNYSSKAWTQDLTSQFSFHQFDRSVLTETTLACGVQRDELRVSEPAGDGSRHPGGVPGVHQLGHHRRLRQRLVALPVLLLPLLDQAPPAGANTVQVAQAPSKQRHHLHLLLVR